MNISEQTRAYIYRVLLALQPVVVAYGLLTEQMAVLWLSVAAAVLGTGLAAVNTSTKAPKFPPILDDWNSPEDAVYDTKGRHVADTGAVRWHEINLEDEADDNAADNDRSQFPYTD